MSVEKLDSIYRMCDELKARCLEVAMGEVEAVLEGVSGSVVELEAEVVRLRESCEVLSAGRNGSSFVCNNSSCCGMIGFGE